MQICNKMANNFHAFNTAVPSYEISAFLFAKLQHFFFSYAPEEMSGKEEDSVMK